MRSRRGFTLIELLVVMALVVLLLSIVAPRYMKQTDRARDAVLRENLSSLRIALDQFYADKGHYPEKLDELVTMRYLRHVPVDPLTKSASTWVPVTVQQDGKSVIYDIHSGASGVGQDGTAYGSW